MEEGIHKGKRAQGQSRLKLSHKNQMATTMKMTANTYMVLARHASQ